MNTQEKRDAMLAMLIDVHESEYKFAIWETLATAGSEFDIEYGYPLSEEILQIIIENNLDFKECGAVACALGYSAIHPLTKDIVDTAALDDDDVYGDEHVHVMAKALEIPNVVMENAFWYDSELGYYDMPADDITALHVHDVLVKVFDEYPLE